ncbi:MAG: hypothetical protein Q8918_16225 [Bacteroidota bacterium]|nr:hypothetical protein [Bacteroidota bacterium]MDP4251650.1 hypothetical protein [Bacteroidota bacterium]
MRILVVLLLAWSSPLWSCAQDSASRWSLTAGAEINSVAVTNPVAVDSAGSSLSVNPYLKIAIRSGLALTAKACFSAGSPNPGYYMTALAPSYGIDNKKIALDLSYAHFFIKQNSAIPYTPITNEVYASFTYKTKTISPRAGLDYGFGTDTSNHSSSAAHDVNLFAGVTRSFDWDTAGAISINFSPSLTLNMGTNRYFNFLRSAKFITNNKNFKNLVKEKGGNGRNGGGNSNPGTTSLPGIELSNLEANVDFTFSIGNFSVEPEGSLFLPISGTDKNIFGYWQLTISYKF